MICIDKQMLPNSEKSVIFFTGDIKQLKEIILDLKRHNYSDKNNVEKNLDNNTVLYIQNTNNVISRITTKDYDIHKYVDNSKYKTVSYNNLYKDILPDILSDLDTLTLKLS